jgi:hypothetical protein
MCGDAGDTGVFQRVAAATKWRDEGRDVRIIKPRELKDWNDVLRANSRRAARTIQRVDLDG